MNHENSWTFSIFSSVVRFHFALPSEPSGWWTPTRKQQAALAAGVKESQDRNKSLHLSWVIGYDRVLSWKKLAGMEVMDPKPGTGIPVELFLCYNCKWSENKGFSPFFQSCLHRGKGLTKHEGSSCPRPSSWAH